MNNANYVTAGKPKVGGAVHVAPLGTTLPTSAGETLGGEWLDVGYISEDGVTNSNSRETNAVKEWGGNTVLTFIYDCGSIWFLSAATAYCLTHFTALSVVWVYFCVKMVEGIKCLIGTGLVAGGSWMKNIVDNVDAA